MILETEINIVKLKPSRDPHRWMVADASKKYDFEYWSSLDAKYVTLTIEAESETAAIREFRSRHPHKKYRILDSLDD